MKLHGHITIVKRLRRNPVWDREPKCYGAAWIDLLMLANDADRTVRLSGEDVKVKRGQLAWSIRSLAQEWDRSDEWTSRFLRFCQDETMIRLEIKKGRHTLITILNYEAYQITPATDSGTEPDTTPATDSGTEPGQKGEGGIGKGNREPGTGGRATTKFQSGSGREFKKNAGATSPAQALFLVDRELAEVNGEIDGLDELNKPVPVALKQRRKLLEKKRGEILTTDTHR